MCHDCRIKSASTYVPRISFMSYLSSTAGDFSESFPSFLDFFVESFFPKRGIINQALILGRTQPVSLNVPKESTPLYRALTDAFPQPTNLNKTRQETVNSSTRRTTNFHYS